MRLIYRVRRKKKINLHAISNEPDDNENFLPLMVKVCLRLICGGKSSDIVDRRLSKSDTRYPLPPMRLKNK